jgi:large subunit ribosomal protein L4
MQHAILNGRGDKAGSLDLSDSVFGAEWHEDLVYRAVTFEAANRRTGTAFFKNRDLMEMTTKKMYKQKGTGGARHGSRSANIFVGGGQAFGGQRHNYKKKLAPVMKARAVAALLSARLKDGKVFVVDSFGVKEGRTKEASVILKKIVPTARRILVVVDKTDALLKRAVKNICGLEAVAFDQLSALPLYQADAIVAEAATLKKLDDRLVRG